MKKTISILFAVYVACVLVGCDVSSSSSSGSSSVLEVNCTIQGITPVPIDDGDIGFFDCGQYRIVVTEDTKLIHSRESCSGLRAVDFNYFQVENILFVGYETKNADYKSSPTVIRPNYVEGYFYECLHGSSTNLVDNPCNTCDDPFFD